MSIRTRYTWISALHKRTQAGLRASRLSESSRDPDRGASSPMCTQILRLFTGQDEVSK